MGVGLFSQGPSNRTRGNGWPLCLSSPAINPGLPGHHCTTPLNTPLKPLKEWGLHHIPEKPVSGLDNPSGEELVPPVQPKPLLAEPKAVSFYPVTCSLGDLILSFMAVSASLWQH